MEAQSVKGGEKFAFDTNIFISRPRTPLSPQLYFSSIVLAELLAGAQDRARIKELETWRHAAVRFDRFLVPTGEDWWEAGKVLQRLSQTSKRENFGSTPKSSPEERGRLFNDCLLAVSCRRARVVVVSDNAKDFERLSAVCRVKWQNGDDFFAQQSAN